MKRLITLVLALIAAGGMVAFPSAANASVASIGPGVDQFAPCNGGGGGDTTTSCWQADPIGLSFVPPYCKPFPSGLQWNFWKDQNPTGGVEQEWTYSNGSHACTQVNYNFGSSLSNDICSFWFYVPVGGFANAHIAFGWWNSTGKHFASWVDENTAEGWIQLNMNGPVRGSTDAIDVTRISFQDNNGDAPGSTVIGWGDDPQHGLTVQCMPDAGGGVGG